MTTAFKSLAAYNGSWRQNEIGYYVHRGVVYLDGVLDSTPASALTQTLLTGLPSDILPRASLGFVLPAPNASYTSDTALRLPKSYAATLHPDGSLTLDDAVPPQLKTTPASGTYFFLDAVGNPHPRYTNPLQTNLELSVISWVIDDQSDLFTRKDLSPYLGSDFTNIDAQYSPHGERVHLAGRVRATVDGATELINPIPPDAQGGLSTTSEHYMVLTHGADKIEADINDVTDVTIDSSITKPAGQPGPLSWAMPPTQAPFGLDATPRSAAVGQNFISQLTRRPGLDSTEVGTGLGLGPGGDADSGSMALGTYECPSATGFDLCRLGGSPTPTTFRLQEILATIVPAPEWFMIAFDWQIVLRQDANDGTCGPSGCGPILFPDWGFSLDVSEGTLLHQDGITPWAFDGTGGGVNGFIAPPTSLYTGVTDLVTDITGEWPNNAPGAIWKWGQITDDITLTPNGLTNQADWGTSVFVVPLYEIPTLALHVGDVVDLDGLGWPGALPDRPIIPGGLQIGPGSGGRVRVAWGIR